MDDCKPGLLKDLQNLKWIFKEFEVESKRGFLKNVKEDLRTTIVVDF